MVTNTKCLNEWNATIEALGHGKQAILIRKYSTANSEFFLYPTSSYTLKTDFTNSFKNKYVPFVEKNALPNVEGKKTEVKYFAKVQSILKIPKQQIGRLDKFHIWTNEHVKSYIGNAGFVWILRVYCLDNPVMSERTRGIKFSNLKEEISLNEMQPVLNDNEFSNIAKKIGRIFPKSKHSQ